jgi:hypothetical protein
MLAVNGIFDGKHVKITDKITETRKYKVIVTFVEEVSHDDNEIRDFSAQVSGLDFWEDSGEDIYQDYLKPKSIGK